MTNVSTDDIAHLIREYIRKQFNVPDSDPDFTDDVHIFDYGYVDSFGAAELTRFVESQFDIKVSQGDLVACPLNTVREIAEFVAKRKGLEG